MSDELDSALRNGGKVIMCLILVQDTAAFIIVQTAPWLWELTTGVLCANSCDVH